MSIIIYTFADTNINVRIGGDASPLFLYRTVVQVDEKIKGYLSEIISDQPDLFVVKVSLSGQRGNQILRVAMDGDEGIAIEKCASISRQLAIWIEDNELITDKFRLEVSSAGLETPLTMERQFVKNIGRKLKVTKVGGEEIEGELVSADKENLILKVNEQEENIAFKEIKKSVIMISFK